MADNAKIKYTDIYCNPDRECANIWEMCFSERTTRRNPGKLWITDPFTNNITVSLPVQQPQQQQRDLQPATIQRRRGVSVAPKKAKKTASAGRKRAKSVAPPKLASSTTSVVKNPVRSRAKSIKAAPVSSRSASKPTSSNGNIVDAPTDSDVIRKRDTSVEPPKSAPSTTSVVKKPVRIRAKSIKAAAVSSSSASKPTSSNGNIVDAPKDSDVIRKRDTSAAPPKLASSTTSVVKNPARSRAKSIKAAPVSSRSGSKPTSSTEDFVDAPTDYHVSRRREKSAFPAKSVASSTSVVTNLVRSRAKSAKATPVSSGLIAEANPTPSKGVSFVVPTISKKIVGRSPTSSIQASPIHRTRSVSAAAAKTSSESKPTASRNRSKSVKKEPEPVSRKRSGSSRADQVSLRKRARSVAVDDKESKPIQTRRNRASSSAALSSSSTTSNSHRTRSKTKTENVKVAFYQQISENVQNLKKTLKPTNFDDFSAELLGKAKAKKNVHFQEDQVAPESEDEEKEEEEEEEHTDDERRLMKFVIDSLRQNPELFEEFMKNDMELFSDWFHNELLPALENWCDFNDDPEGSGIEDRDKDKFIVETQADGTIVEIPVEPYPVIFPMDIQERLRDRLYKEQERRADQREQAEMNAERNARFSRDRDIFLYQMRQRNAQVYNNTTYFNNIPRV